MCYSLTRAAAATAQAVVIRDLGDLPGVLRECLSVSEAAARKPNPARNRAGLPIGEAVEYLEVVSPKGC